MSELIKTTCIALNTTATVLPVALVGAGMYLISKVLAITAVIGWGF